MGQLRNRQKCHGLVSGDERATGKRFDWVLYARPDLLWYRPLLPWCLWGGLPWSPTPPKHAARTAPAAADAPPHGALEASRRRSPSGDLRPWRKWDWAFLTTRRHADALLEAPDRDYWACRAPFNAGDVVELWLQRARPAPGRELSSSGDGEPRAGHGAVLEFADDASVLPCVVLREDGPTFPHNHCNNGIMRVAEGGMAVRWKDCERMTFRNPYNARANATATPEAATRAAAPAEARAAGPRRANATARGEHGPIVGPTRRHRQRSEATKKARREAHAGPLLGP